MQLASKEQKMMNFFFRNGTAAKCKCVLRRQHYLQPQLHLALQVKATGQSRLSRQTYPSKERQETRFVIVGDKWVVVPSYRSASYDIISLIFY